MKIKKMSIFFVFILLLNSILFAYSTTAGDESDPEIVDEQDTAVLDYLDIISAWFFEKENEPEYLFTALKMRQISPYHLKQHLTVHWEHNGIECASGLNIGYGDPWFSYDAGYGHGFWFQEHYQEIQGEYDEETGIIICKIPKSMINNPQKGDVLTNTKALTFQRFGFIGRLGFNRFFISSMISLLTGNVPWDGAPYEYGRDYIIQY
jgi:hypothetical protein